MIPMIPSSDAGSLLLGYSLPPDTGQPIGFQTGQGAALPSPPARPVLFPRGGGPLLVFGRTGSGKGVSNLIPLCLRARDHPTGRGRRQGRGLGCDCGTSETPRGPG